MSDQNAGSQRVFEVLRELVEQIESGNRRDDHGHPLKNLKALRDARAIVDEVKGNVFVLKRPLPQGGT